MLNHKNGFPVTHPLLAMSVPESLVPSCSESLKHWVCHTFVKTTLLSVDVIKYQVTKQCHVWLNPPFSFSLRWAAIVAVLCKMWISLTQVLGSLVQCCPCPCRGWSQHLSEMFPNTLDPPKQQRSAAKLLEQQAAEFRVWHERSSAFTHGRSGAVCADCLLTQGG